MAWNHKTRVFAVAVAIQSTANTFTAPNTTTDLIAAGNVTNSHEALKADDPTGTGSVWESRQVRLGRSATVGFTIPLRGPGGASPPALNAWPTGRVMQACGWSEIRKASASTAALVASSTTTALKLAVSESSTDDALIGSPLQHADIGTGFKATTLIMDYVGSTRLATIPETLAGAPADGSNYTIPAHLSYVLGSMSSAPPLLSYSIWRDKKRYDYSDWRPSSQSLEMPVANDANQASPNMGVSGKALIVAVADDTTPTVPASVLAVSIPPARDGKFYLDRVKLGHQSITFTISTTLGAPSNQNQAQGQDGYEILSGTRVTSIDLNQMAVSDFDIDARDTAQTVMSMISTWGLGAGNNFGFLLPDITIDPFNPGDRNGFVNLTGEAGPVSVDKSAALTIWW